jgi:hypothetical protein
MRHDGNWLVTTFLQPGEHTFTVRVIGTQGQTATDAVQAVVSLPPKPPAELVGVWNRTSPVSARIRGGDTSRSTRSVGRSATRTAGANQDVSYPASGKVLIRAAIEEPPFGSYDRGRAFCGEQPDPPGPLHLPGERWRQNAHAEARGERLPPGDSRGHMVTGQRVRRVDRDIAGTWIESLTCSTTMRQGPAREGRTYSAGAAPTACPPTERSLQRLGMRKGPRHPQ